MVVGTGGGGRSSWRGGGLHFLSAVHVGVIMLGPTDDVIGCAKLELAFAELFFLRVFFPAYSNQISIIV